MILKKNENRVALPEPIDSFTAQLIIFPLGDPKYHPGSYGTMVPMDRVTDMMHMQKKNPSLKGLPECFGVLSGDELFLFPTPDKDYYAVLRFNPPMKEI